MTNATIYADANNFTASDFYWLDFNDVVITNVSTTGISGTVGQFSVVIGGNLSLYGSQISGGTINSMKVSYGAAPLTYISDFSIEVSRLASSSEAQLTGLMFAGDDTVRSYWNVGDRYFLYGGDDRVELGTGNDVVDGGSGRDTFAIDASFNSAEISASAGSLRIESAYGVDTLSNFEIIAFRDTSYSVRFAPATSLYVYGDTDPLVRKDYLIGGNADNRMWGKKGGDWIFGEAGTDTIWGNAGADVLSGGGGADLLYGGVGSDKLIGGRSADALYGGDGADRLIGGHGNDRMFGGAGRDTLAGGDGKDKLYGGAGADMLTGGDGRDIFCFKKGSGQDVISDFQLGQDRIEIGTGASELKQLSFEKQGKNVLIAFSNVEILVEDVRLFELHNAENFIF